MTTSTRFQQGSLMRVKNKTTPDTWFFRYREDRADRRVYRNLKIGTVRDLPHRRDAERAVLSLRANINNGVRVPETVNDLITHYTDRELTADRKAFSTIDAHSSYLKLHIAPQWGARKLSDVRTVAVEEWLQSLAFAPGTRTKIRNIMSAIFTHAIRYEWLSSNPISKVRCSAMRQREPDVITPEEFRAILPHLATRERAMVMLAGSTGISRSEMFALRWSDVDVVAMQVAISRGVVRNHFGRVKTPARRKPVPLHPSVCAVLADWRRESLYGSDDDFLFPSLRLNGSQPLSPDTVLKKIIRPAIQKAGIRNKVLGWHSFRHSLATNLRSLGVDVKVAQELLRHANHRVTMDVYTRAVSADKRAASTRQTALLLGEAAA